MFRAKLVALVCVGLVLSGQSSGQEPHGSNSPDGGVRMQFVDVDGDGIPDLHALRAGADDQLLRGRGDGSFEDRTDSSGLRGQRRTRLALWRDFDQDQRQDLLLVLEDGRCRLFRNAGSFVFDDVTRRASLEELNGLVSAEWLDFDVDGRPDLHFVGATGDWLYRNLDRQTFGKVQLGLPDPIPELPGPITAKPAPGDPKAVDPDLPGARTGSGQPPRADDPELPHRELAVGGSVVPGGPSTETMAGSDTYYLNDNSPGSVGVGVPEVEGGNDSTIPNDIVDGTVTGADVKDGTLTGNDLLNRTVTGDDIDLNTVTSANILNGTVDTNDLAVGAVQSLQIEDDSIQGADVRLNTLNGNHIQNGSLTGADIQDGMLTRDDIQDNTLTGAQIQDNSLTGADIQDGMLTGDDIQDGSLTGADLASSLTITNLTAGGDVLGTDLRVRDEVIFQSDSTSMRTAAINSGANQMTQVGFALDGSYRSVAARSISCPAAGYVLAIGSCRLKAFSNGDNRALVSISESSGSASGIVGQWSIDPKDGTDPHNTVTISHLMWVTGSGPKSVYLNAMETTGDVRALDGTLTLVYLPKAY